MNFPLINRDIPAVVRAAQLIGVTGAGILAGANLVLSIIVVPALMDAPAPVAAKQWQKVYDIGKATIPPGTLVIGTIFGFLAWRERGASSSSLGLYSAAALLAPTMIPYTILLMKPTNDRLSQKAKSLAASSAGDAGAEAGVAKEDTVNALLERWGTLNLVRGLLIATSAILGAWASLQPTEVLGLDKVEIFTNANRLG